MSDANPRVLLFTGKGGVGKTTSAAATALTLAARGKRVLVTSADPAHSLGDALGADLGTEPALVAPRCWAQQVDALERMEQSWGDIRGWLVDVFNWAGLSTVEAEELATFPGVEELVALLEIETLFGSGRFDVIVVDCAPTAESLRLLSLPDMLDWYMQKLFPASKRISRLVSPVLSRLTDIPMADPAVFTSGERLQRQLTRVRDLLTNPEITSVRLVLTPEKMVVAEARRSHTYLSLFGYHVDAAIINRLLPEHLSSEFMDDWRKAQSEQVKLIEEAFDPMTLLRAPLHPGEVLGPSALTEFGQEIWAEHDPESDLHPGRPLRMERDVNGSSVLVMELPNVDGDEIRMTQQDCEVSISVGPYRRNLLLPDSLRGRQVSSAIISEGELRLGFID